MYNRFLKRVLDLLLSTAGIVVLGIPMLVIALLIKITDPGSVLFKQRRIGIHKSIFELYKPPRIAPPICWKTRSSISPPSAVSCAKAAWMSCPSCSTSGRGRCR